MADEKLIDALAKIQCAIEGRTHGFSLDEVVAPGIERWTRHRYEAEILLRDIREAGYVFEKAHAKELDTSTEPVKNWADSLHVAPTGDAAEREEISRIIDGHIDVPVSSRLVIARSLQGNGFRRSEAPEPQREHFHIWSDLPCKPGGCRMEPQAEPFSDHSERYVPKRPKEPQGEPSGHRAILIQKAREHADEWRRYDDTEELVGTLVEMANMLASIQEPQGEPSDAEVSAALLGYFPEVKDQKELQKWGKRTRERMRSALRAAGEVKR